MEEYLSADGRVFKKDLRGNFHEVGGKEISVSGKEMEDFEKYTGTKTERLKDTSKTHPRFSEMAWDKSKL